MSQLLESMRKEIDGVKMNRIPVAHSINAKISCAGSRGERCEYDSIDDRQSASFSVPSLVSTSSEDQDHPSHQTNYGPSEIADEVENHSGRNDDHATSCSEDDHPDRRSAHLEKQSAERTNKLENQDSKAINDDINNSSLPSVTSSFSCDSEDAEIRNTRASELESEYSQANHEKLVDFSPISRSSTTGSPSIRTTKTTVQNDTSTMDHELIRAKAYTILLSTSNSVKINSFTTSFEEEGLFGLSFGILQDFTSKAIHAITGLSQLKHEDGESSSNHVIVFQFAILANLMLRALGLHQKSGTQNKW